MCLDATTHRICYQTVERGHKYHLTAYLTFEWQCVLSRPEGRKECSERFTAFDSAGKRDFLYNLEKKKNKAHNKPNQGSLESISYEHKQLRI